MKKITYFALVEISSRPTPTTTPHSPPPKKKETIKMATSLFSLSSLWGEIYNAKESTTITICGLHN
jgi:hypothetical protein